MDMSKIPVTAMIIYRRQNPLSRTIVLIFYFNDRALPLTTYIRKSQPRMHTTSLVLIAYTII